MYIPGTTTLEKDALHQTTKAQSVSITANSHINETGRIFSHLILVCPAGFLKNQLPPFPLQLLQKFYCPFRKGAGVQETMLICKDAQVYAVWIYISPTQNFMLAIIVLFVLNQLNYSDQSKCSFHYLYKFHPGNHISFLIHTLWHITLTCS